MVAEKKSQVRFLRDMNFCWDPGIFTVLGTKFSTDVKQITSINYEGKLTEIKRILNTWSKRQVTPLGKITVIKTLALSRVIYLFVNLLDPQDDALHEHYYFSSCERESRVKLAGRLSARHMRMED